MWKIVRVETGFFSVSFSTLETWGKLGGAHPLPPGLPLPRRVVRDRVVRRVWQGGGRPARRVAWARGGPIDERKLQSFTYGGVLQNGAYGSTGRVNSCPWCHDQRQESWARKLGRWKATPRPAMHARRTCGQSISNDESWSAKKSSKGYFGYFLISYAVPCLSTIMTSWLPFWWIAIKRVVPFFM